MSEYLEVRNYVSVQCAGHAKESKLHPAVSQDTGSPGNGWVLAASTSARYGLARWIYEERWGKYMWDEIASTMGKIWDVENIPTMMRNSVFGGLISWLRKQELWIGRVACRMRFLSWGQNRNPTESEANLFSPTASSNDMRLH